MTDIKLELDDKKHGAFYLHEEGKKMGEMVVSIRDNKLTVYHTEVDLAAAGKGFAGLLLAEMVKYVRENNLTVIPLCPYVHAQFKRHPDTYQDIWFKENK
ncbi:GNAT family N-acetyltransferase [Flavobacterium beibuense]|uniref:Acetyltransferase-like protein n=1 Tax=Flavobacterium beibuense TaxID=657326 RepID=A0A444WAB9_9FLAO|nr:GNAT family N-acetyltransferase [Flavobacterium beibuense]RYJ42794.1 Acetyltransferase-like protein [Flavobacterium beibuense]